MKALHHNQIKPLSEVSINPLDRGFLFGDAVYQTFLIDNEIVDAQLHLGRLMNNLEEIGIRLPYSLEQLTNNLEALAATWSEPLGVLYLQVSRGAAPTRRHAAGQEGDATVFAFVQAHPDPTRKLRQGVTAITVRDKRGYNCHIKSTSLMTNTLAKSVAFAKEAYEAIQIDADGFVTEGTSANIFIRQGNELVTPASGARVLPGVMRERVIKWAKSANIPCFERPISHLALLGADEVWMTGSVHQVLPIIQVDSKPIGNGAGALYKRCVEELLCAKSTEKF